MRQQRDPLTSDGRLHVAGPIYPHFPVKFGALPTGAVHWPPCDGPLGQDGGMQGRVPPCHPLLATAIQPLARIFGQFSPPTFREPGFRQVIVCSRSWSGRWRRSLIAADGVASLPQCIFGAGLG